MRRARAALSATVAASLFTASIASAEPCARPADVAAFGTAGLKSQLMVTALTCSQQDRYNDFVHRFQKDLMAQERALKAYFARAFGGRAQQEHDDYITSLANAQSQNGIHQGTVFCQRNVGIFDEVLALPKGADLASYASGKALVQPIDLVTCPTRPEPTRTAQARITHQ
jgi:hypothetical protein